MNPSPLKLDLAAVHCISLELQFTVIVPKAGRDQMAALGSREPDEEDRVYFHEDYRQDDQKLHSWAEVRLAELDESDVVIEYLTEGELEDQTELHHSEFTLSHLFDALREIAKPVEAAFTLRFDLDAHATTKFVRLLPYNAGINGGLAVEYRGAHIQIKAAPGETFDLWYDLRADDTMEATVRFTLTEPPTEQLPGHGLDFGRRALARVLAH